MPFYTSFILFIENGILKKYLFEKVGFDFAVDDNYDVESVWLKIWEGVVGVSNVIWQGFLSFVSGDLWTVDVGTDEIS